MDASFSSTPQATPVSPLRRILAVAERFVVAHVASYPIAFVWAVASIPLTIHLSARRLDDFGRDMDAVGRFIVLRLAWPAGAAFVLAHAAAILWVAARDAKRGQRRCLAALGGLAGTGIVFGGASWLWLVLR